MKSAQATTQKAIMLVEPNTDLKAAKFEVREVDVPTPKPGQVLVKMSAAPINPSDFGSWMRSTPGVEYPKVVGNEGSGVVVASGGGLMAGRLVGKTVGVVGPKGGKTGTYQQYVVADAMKEVWPLGDLEKAEDGASFFVNPYTAVGILDTVKSRGQNVFIHTAASSQLGQMMIKLAPMQGMTIVNVVRREEQAEMLKKIGAEHVVVQTEGWEERLRKLIDELKIMVAFDCIAGETTGTIVSLMPRESTTYVYGALSERPVGNVSPLDLIYHKKHVEGWLLTGWLMAGGTMQMLSRARAATALVNPGLKPDGWCSSQFEDCAIDEFFEKFHALREGSATGRKLRIRLDRG